MVTSNEGIFSKLRGVLKPEQVRELVRQANACVESNGPLILSPTKCVGLNRELVTPWKPCSFPGCKADRLHNRLVCADHATLNIGGERAGKPSVLEPADGVASRVIGTPRTISVDLLRYKDTKAIFGNSKSSAGYKCAWGDRYTAAAALLRNLDPFDSYLTVHQVDIDYFRDDAACGWGELNVESIPTWKVLMRLPGNPFRIRFEDADMSVSVKGAYHWETGGEPLDSDDVLPTRKFVVVKASFRGCVLFADWGIGTWSGLVDHVNSDTWEGAAPGTLLFRPWQADERQDDEGDMVWDLDCRVEFKPSGWNYFPKKSGAMVRLLDGSGNPVYPGAAFTGSMPVIAS